MRDLLSASSGFLCTKKLSWFSFPTGIQQGWKGAGRGEGGSTPTDGSKGA